MLDHVARTRFLRTNVDCGRTGRGPRFGRSNFILRRRVSRRRKAPNIKAGVAGVRLMSDGLLNAVLEHEFGIDIPD